MKKIVLTGGGTAGHVTPNIALIPELKKQGYSISYIGSYEGIERKLIADLDIPYYPISSGKLRRYIDIKNLSDPFKVIKGLHQARKLLKKIKPDVVFSKGGFVSVPVVLAAKSRKIPCVIHESDMTPGLANKICIPCANRVCTNFPETIKHLPPQKAVLTGSPIREELFHGDKEKGLAFCGFTDEKPTLLIIGGSLGAVAVNTAVRSILPKLLEKFQIIHLCGKGKLDESLNGTKGYVQYEYIRQKRENIEYIKKINILDQCVFYLVITEVNEPLIELDFITLENVIIKLLYILTQVVTEKNIERKYHRDLEYRMLNGSLSEAEEDDVANLLNLDATEEYRVITFYLKPEMCAGNFSADQRKETEIVEKTILNVVPKEYIYCNTNRVIYIHKENKKEEKLECYLNQKQSIRKTSELMNIHARTVSYRLQKIVKLTGMNFDNIAEMLAVRNGIIILKILEQL